MSKHRLTKRWEASCWVKKKQLYLGGFDCEEKAARAYDIAALVCKGLGTHTNFACDDYKSTLEHLEGCTQEELVAHIRRQSCAFARGKSKYRGVSGQSAPKNRWEARIGQFCGKKNVSFGVFDTEEAAAMMYDRALIVQRGPNAKTNFDINVYREEVKHAAADTEWPDVPQTKKITGVVTVAQLADALKGRRIAGEGTSAGEQGGRGGEEEG